MSVINPANTLEFKPTDSLFARVRKRLKSFDAAGVLDEGDWYYMVKEIIDLLGVAVYDEKEALTVVNDYKALLPEDFSYIYAAYSCSLDNNNSGSKQTVFPQTGFVFYLEETHEPYRTNRGRCGAKKEVCGDKMTIRYYIEGNMNTANFNTPHLLRLSGNVKGLCAQDSPCLSSRSADEITLSKGRIHTNFASGSILLKYYGMAIDHESGLPMIPDNSIIEKAIEDYIVFRVFEDNYLDGTVPDLERRHQLVKDNYENSYKTASYFVKLPSFQTVINKIRRDRNNLGIYQQTA